MVDRAFTLATGLPPGAARDRRAASTIRCASATCSPVADRHEAGGQAAPPRAGQPDGQAVGASPRRSRREIELLEIKGQIEASAQKEMSDAQRQYFLRQQLKAIQSELGESEGQEMQDLRERIDAAKLPEHVAEGGHARGRSPRAHAAGVARISDDPHLHRLGARRAVVEDDRGSARTRSKRAACSTTITTTSTRSRSASSNTSPCAS